MPTNAASRAVELLMYVVREGSALSCEGYSYVWPELVGDQGILSMGRRINYLLPFHDGSAKTKMFVCSEFCSLSTFLYSVYNLIIGLLFTFINFFNL